MKKIGCIILSLFICGCSQNKQVKNENDHVYKDGTYTSTAQGYGGDFKVSVTLKDDKIVDIIVDEHNETPSLGGVAIEQMITQMKDKNSYDVDIVSGATKTSQGMIEAVKVAIQGAKDQTK